MKNLNNSTKPKNKKKTAPAPSPSRVSGGMGRQIGSNPQNRQNPKNPQKPVPSKKTKPAAKKKSPKKQPNQPMQTNRSNQQNQPNGAVKSGDPVLQKKPAKKPSAPVKPVDKRTRKAADKAARNKQAAVKKTRYHGGNYILYYIFAGIIVVLVLIVLANTVLFKCKEITVSGNVRYTSDKITADSGLTQGMNLLHVNRKGAAEKIVSALPYVDSAEVKCSFPSTIEISVVEAEKRFAVQEGTVTAAVSYKGKIVEQGYFSDLPLVIGMEAESIKTGSWLKSKVDGKNDIPNVILDAAESAMMDNISKIDITDRFSLDMELDNGRIIIKLGTVSDMENKVKIAKDFVDTEVGDTESVTIIVSNPTRVTLRPNVPNEEPETPNEPEIPGEPENSGTPGDTSSAASSQ